MVWYNRSEVVIMISKNIVFTKPGTAELIPEPVAPLAPGEILVKLRISTVSGGTERANLAGSKTVSWKKKDEEASPFPRRVGYSSAGIVIEVGEGVTRFQPGDRVALWWSKYEQYHRISETKACKIDDDVSFEDASIFHIATFPLGAIRKCRLEIGESAVVMGLGILGLTALQLLKAAGAVPVIAVDPDPKKREKALACGADLAFDPFDAGFAAKVKEATNGGAKVGIEVTGVGAGLDEILDCMAPFGRVALLGCTRNSDFTIDYYRKVHGPGVTLIGAHTMARPQVESHGGWWTQEDDMAALIALTKAGRIDLASMVDETHSPDETPAIFDRLLNEKTFPIVQFDWRML